MNDVMWAVGLEVQVTTSMSRFPVHSVRPTLKFAMEIEANDALLFFDVLVMKRGPNLATKYACMGKHVKCFFTNYILVYKNISSMFVLALKVFRSHYS
jgi:hypothetical protein